MAIREILEIPDPLLKQISQPVEHFDDELKALVADMLETMYDAPGIGLAAVQVGVPQRVLVIDLQPDDPDAEPEECTAHGGHSHSHSHQPTKKEPRVFINPEILDPSDDFSVCSEGCLSVPEIFADVERPSTVRVRWHDLDGAAHEETMDGLMATCIQHEMDHLEGILFVDHLSRLKRQMALKKLDKLRKAA
jgi:peptide deformylase